MVPRREILGVVRHLNLHDLKRPLLRQVYFPMTFGGQFSGRDFFSIVIRTDPDAQDATPAVRAAVEAMGSGVVLQDLELIEDVVARATTNDRVLLLLMSMFGLSALGLASIGLYGVLALAVRLRTKEIAIRVSLGQHPGSVVRLVVRQGMRTALVATALGLPTAALAADRLASFLFGVSPFDPVTYVAGTLLVLGCSLLACWLPARHATRIEPSSALAVE